jgi:hypothetical protein
MCKRFNLSNLRELSTPCQVMAYVEEMTLWEGRNSVTVKSMCHKSLGRVEVCYSSGAFNALLSKILQACQLELMSTQQPIIKAVMSLGVYSSKFEPGLYTLIQPDQSKVLWLQSYPLDKLSVDAELKKNLWSLLKKLFY